MATGVGTAATATTAGASGAMTAAVSAMTAPIEGGVVVVVVEATEWVEIVDDSQSSDHLDVGRTMGESGVEPVDVKEVVDVEDATKLVEQPELVVAV